MWTCRRSKSGMQIEAMHRLASERDGLCLSEEYFNSSSNLRWRCSKGHEWEAKPAQVKRGTWCPQSGKDNASNANRKWSLEKICAIAEERGGSCLERSFTSIAKPMRWRCSEGHEWEAVALNIIHSKSWCRECGKRKIGNANRKWSLEKICAIAEERGGSCLERSFTSIKNRMRWRCSEGHEWEASGKNVIHRKSWCPYCAGKADVTIDRLHEAARKKGGQCLASKCEGAQKKVMWKCSEGHTFKASPQHVIHSESWCRLCATSRGESFCRIAFEKIFKAKFPNVRPEFLLRNSGFKLELDGYNSDLKLAFEHHGSHHYNAKDFQNKSDSQSATSALKQRVQDDLEKKALCQKHGVTLIEIPEVPSMTKLKVLQKTIIALCQSAGIAVPSEARKIEIDYSDAYTSPRVNKLYEKYRLIALERGGELVSTFFEGSHQKHTWKCAKGHTWEATPSNISSRKSWCPKCSNESNANASRKWSIDKINSVVAERGGSCLEKSITNLQNRMRWRCSKGHEWETSGHSVIHGKSWCPFCAKKTVWKTRRQNAIAKTDTPPTDTT
jgi:Probable Zinc-ribbon domain